MTQADSVVVDNSTGGNVRTGFNDAVAAALTMNSGDTPPPDTMASMPWLRETLFRMSFRTPSNLAWRHQFTFDEPEPPGAQHNEAAGYPACALWGTADGRLFWHRGQGLWTDVSSGGGASSGGGGFGMFADFGSMYVRDESDAAGMIVDNGSMYVREE